MKKIIFCMAYLLMGVTMVMANQVSENKESTSPLLIYVEDKDNKVEVEIDTIATTKEEWWSIFTEKQKEGWCFKALIYQEGKDVLLILDRPKPTQENKSRENVDNKYCNTELVPDQPDYYIEDAYYESSLGVIHIVDNKIVELVFK